MMCNDHNDFERFKIMFKIIKYRTPISVYELLCQSRRNTNFLMILPKIRLDISKFNFTYICTHDTCEQFKKINYYLVFYPILTGTSIIAIVFKSFFLGFILSIILFPIFPDKKKIEKENKSIT